MTDPERLELLAQYGAALVLADETAKAYFGAKKIVEDLEARLRGMARGIGPGWKLEGKP